MIFVRFLSQVKKHHTLALLSALRLHKIQAMMNLRQTVEAGACAAYALANPNPDDFATTTELGILDSSQALAKKRYRWLNQNFREASDYLRTFKQNINSSTAHANIAYTTNNFRLEENRELVAAPFFDFEDSYYVKTDLWMIGSLGLSLLNLFVGVNRQYPVLTLIPDFQSRCDELIRRDSALEAEMKATERFKESERLYRQSSGRGSTEA